MTQEIADSLNPQRLLWRNAQRAPDESVFVRCDGLTSRPVPDEQTF